MPKKTGIAMLAAGAVLIFAALLLLIYNWQESEQAGNEAEGLMNKVETVIDAQESSSADLSQPELPVVDLGGYECVGNIEIPALELKLPVLSEWDYDRLKIAPCRQFGSSRTDDLVIAGHNYRRHFGRLKNLRQGDSVIFTDMEGVVNTYSVQAIRTLDPNEVNAVQNSGYDLVLYTCTLSGTTRTAVFCSRAEP